MIIETPAADDDVMPEQDGGPGSRYRIRRQRGRKVDQARPPGRGSICRSRHGPLIRRYRVRRPYRGRRDDSATGNAS